MLCRGHGGKAKVGHFKTQMNSIHQPVHMKFDENILNGFLKTELNSACDIHGVSQTDRWTDGRIDRRMKTDLLICPG